MSNNLRAFIFWYYCVINLTWCFVTNKGGFV